MAFSRSGSLITQTGTDTNLSGLTSALGASNIYSNGGASPLNRTVYDFASPNYRLRVNGTLSFDPANEELWMPGTNNAIQVGSSGNLFIGGSRTFNGFISYSKEQAIFFDQRGSSHTAGNPWIDVLSGGDFDWSGGVITMHAAGDFLRNGIVNAGTLRQGIQLSSSSNDTYALFLEDITINDLLIDGRSRLVIRNAAVTINAIRLIHTAGLFADGNVAPNLTTYPPVQGYDREVVDRDYTYWRGGKLRLRNSSIGSNAVALGNGASGTSNVNSTGLLAIEQDLTVTIVDTSGAPITSGIWFIRDYDNGNRQNAGYVGGSGASNASVNLLADNTYDASFGAGGTHSPVTIVTAYGNRTSASSNEVGTYDNGPNRYDRRTKNDVPQGVNLDEMDVFVWSYLYLPTTLTPSLIGLGGTEVNTTLFDDPSITETNPVTVAAYTTIGTLARLYDRAKEYKLSVADVEFPAVDQFLMVGAGGNVNMNVDTLIIGASGPAFTVNKGTSQLDINAGDLAPGGPFDTLVVGNGQAATLAGGATMSANLTVQSGGSFTLPDVADLTGNINISGDLLKTSSGGGTIPAGSVSSTGRIIVVASALDDQFDARNVVFDPSSVIENQSGVNINILVDFGQTQPLTLETSGTITFVNPLIQPTFTVVGLVPDSEVRIYEAGTTTELAGIESSGATFGYTYTYTADFPVDLVVHKEDYVYVRVEGIVLTDVDASLPVQQQFDRNFNNPP